MLSEYALLQKASLELSLLLKKNLTMVQRLLKITKTTTAKL